MTEEKKPQKKTYVTTRNVEHNNERTNEGDEIELTDKEAETLLECGAVVDPDAPAEKPAKSKKK